ncbi:MAG: hypothetical protein GWN99_18255 [Gemmatimonadetes bacterium]|uniref:Uncharacterized protein n=1 Tax=Candidatus Kutchimonas denitrificans TaxID=3056748 RepID=A0AAE4ZAS2_9BACT|nr:hypothetical protein [Gemmatimonadota bacterium]NIR73990.1 hypothetical protein [Candidatus Kutchimonas denitrificans]NIS02979.1 hypothetical protein [Gemmatimonadota bacterium]NIT68696.1 hypothetical protein [Gemmatimonadota bacterium]NIU53277.1 hypothetical protein [Gemmatimonadota bacterium]
MIYLATQILFCVLIAALIGGFLGWLLRGQSAAARRAALEAELSQRTSAMERAEAERDRLSARNDSLVIQLEESRRQATENEARQQVLERELAASRERVVALDQEARAARERAGSLESELAVREERVRELSGSLEAARSAAATSRPAAPARPKPGPPRERPAWALAAPEGEADDLKRIRGVGPKLSNLLNDLGIYHFRQIARFTPADIEWVGSQLKAFPGRIVRDRWVEQARELHFEKYGERL